MGDIAEQAVEVAAWWDAAMTVHQEASDSAEAVRQQREEARPTSECEVPPGLASLPGWEGLKVRPSLSLFALNCLPSTVCPQPNTDACPRKVHVQP